MKYYKTIQINNRQVRLHRYLMEQKLGRKLLSTEIVHHCDGDKHNNNIKNLEVVSRGEHMKIHPLIKQRSIESLTKYQISFECVFNLYINQKLSRYQIAKKLNIPVYTITWFMDKNRIVRKPRCQR